MMKTACGVSMNWAVKTAYLWMLCLQGLHTSVQWRQVQRMDYSDEVSMRIYGRESRQAVTLTW